MSLSVKSSDLPYASMISGYLRTQSGAPLPIIRRGGWESAFGYLRIPQSSLRRLPMHVGMVYAHLRRPELFAALSFTGSFSEPALATSKALKAASSRPSVWCTRPHPISAVAGRVLCFFVQKESIGRRDVKRDTSVSAGNPNSALAGRMWNIIRTSAHAHSSMRACICSRCLDFGVRMHC